MGVFLRWYSHNLKKHQFAMNMVTTGTVFFVGDILSQQVVEKKREDHDINRTCRSVTVGSFYSTPIIVYLYNFVDKLFGPSQTRLNAIKKIGVLSLFSPLTNAGYIFCNNALQLKPLEETARQIVTDVPRIVLTGYSIWFPTHFVLLTAVPLRHRVLFSNLVGVMWTCYLTHASNSDSISASKGSGVEGEEEKEEKF